MSNPTYTRINDNQFQLTVDSTSQLDIGTMLTEMANHQTLVDEFVVHLQNAAIAGCLNAQPALNLVTPQGLTSVGSATKPLAQILAAQITPIT